VPEDLRRQGVGETPGAADPYTTESKGRADCPRQNTAYGAAAVCRNPRKLQTRWFVSGSYFVEITCVSRFTELAIDGNAPAISDPVAVNLTPNQGS
jgi:hypothetical protein